MEIKNKCCEKKNENSNIFKDINLILLNYNFKVQINEKKIHTIGSDWKILSNENGFLNELFLKLYDKGKINEMIDVCKKFFLLMDKLTSKEYEENFILDNNKNFILEFFKLFNIEKTDYQHLIFHFFEQYHLNKSIHRFSCEGTESLITYANLFLKTTQIIAILELIMFVSY